MTWNDFTLSLSERYQLESSKQRTTLWKLNDDHYKSRDQLKQQQKYTVLIGNYKDDAVARKKGREISDCFAQKKPNLTAQCIHVRLNPQIAFIEGASKLAQK